ncbi:Centromere that resembles histones required for proper kinetochore function [Fusarium albosuccineum]|uniref:Centromere that resembles histones required for proper kinetochore function n=1 Tax=Fusarium albosuccineum TaxID=1237068 RepID=A0A8H4LKM2_9HYPO|nr:Centromere that resembles histones required for proper kinetochore function [Fusarium albosuccineum]
MKTANRPLDARRSEEIRKRKRLAIRKTPFARLVREIVHDIKGEHFAMEHMALLALQEAAENFIVYLFQASQVLFLRGKRATLHHTDIQLIRHILTIFPPEYHRALMYGNGEEGVKEGAEKAPESSHAAEDSEIKSDGHD